MLSGIVCFAVVFAMITGVALVCLLGLGDIVMGQQAWNPVHTICNLNSGRSSIVGNRMYIDGGQIVDQMYFKNGTDQPYDYSDLVSWSSESLSNQCPILFKKLSLY